MNFKAFSMSYQKMSVDNIVLTHLDILVKGRRDEACDSYN